MPVDDRRTKNGPAKRVRLSIDQSCTIFQVQQEERCRQILRLHRPDSHFLRHPDSCHRD